MMGIADTSYREPTFHEGQKILTTEHAAHSIMCSFIADSSHKEATIHEGQKKAVGCTCCGIPSLQKKVITEHADKENRLSDNPVSTPRTSRKRTLSPSPLRAICPPSPPLALAVPTATRATLKRQRSFLASQLKSSEGCLSLMSSAVHQFGLVGNGEDYDSKETRLKQLLERIEGPAIIFASTTQACMSIQQIIEESRAALEKTQPDHDATLCNSPLSDWPRLKTKNGRSDSIKLECSDVAAAFPCITVEARDSRPYRGPASYRCVINYDLPQSGKKYLEYLTALGGGPACEPLGYVYTFVQEKELGSKRLSPIIGLLQRVRQAAERSGDRGMVAEALSALQQLGAVQDEEEEEEEEEEELDPDNKAHNDDDEDCDCGWCRSHCSIAYYTSKGPSRGRSKPSVEVVRIPIRALEDLDGIKSMIAPRLEHSCTLICLHPMMFHDPWDSFEHCFALPEGLGTIRVVLVLAKGCSWHEYPDHGTLMGGVAWVDILDWDSMSKTDSLLEGLVNYEISMLGGTSHRVFLAGTSQGGGQSFLRFIRSKEQLGGWIGGVCHAPTAPHLPRQHDVVGKQQLANAGRPVRLLCGESDSVFPPSLVLRDVERLRTVGGFNNIKVDVTPGLHHEDLEGEKDEDPPCEMMYISEHLSEILISSNEFTTPVKQH